MFTSVIASEYNLKSFVICTAASVILGLLIALSFMFKNTKYTKSFVLSLALLPVIVQVIIAMVNGNIGVGVAVAGTFSLVRFRSVPGSAREIVSVFACMAVGLTTGMGYIGVAVVFTLVVILLSMLYTLLNLGGGKSGQKILKVTIPESLEYSSVFDDIFDEYTQSRELVAVKTKSMGSLYQLTYRIVIRDTAREKEFIDSIRCRNGNLDISCLIPGGEGEEL